MSKVTKKTAYEEKTMSAFKREKFTPLQHLQAVSMMNSTFIKFMLKITIIIKL
jgi:hypothetical protein